MTTFMAANGLRMRTDKSKSMLPSEEVSAAEVLTYR